MEERNSKLWEIAQAEQKRQMTSNRKNISDEYGAGDPDALSDGDALGKGLNNGSIGSSDDIVAHQRQIASNIYGPSKEYS